MEAGDGGFLAAVLRSGGGEDAAYLADQSAAKPDGSGLVEEGAHLAGHVAEARGSAENDGVGFGEIVQRGGGDFCERGARSFGAVFFEDVVGDGFGYLK